MAGSVNAPVPMLWAVKDADHWSIKVLSVAMMILFTAMRGIFLPVMIVTLPLPPKLTQYYPPSLVVFLQWFAFWTFSALLIIPWLFCVHRLVTSSIGRKKRIKEVLDDRTAPKTVIVMPVYKEDPEILIKAIDSVVHSDYPSYCIHVFLSYDGVNIDEPYLRVINHLGIPIFLDTYPQSIDVTYEGARITVSRFKHGGKRHCQKLTFRLIDKVYAEYNSQHDNLFMLLIDSDCVLDQLCLQNLMYDMELKPGSKHNMLAMTGIITSTTEKNSLITVLQDLEYIHGQLFERSVESGCGAVTCLPGALTILRFSAFRKMAKYYFADKAEQCEDLFDYAKCHLGEDRWLTHLFMIGAKERYQIQMCTSAFCKTEAAQTFRSLLKQRRRWFLGYITNELKRFKAWLYPLMFVLNPFFNWLYMVYGIFTAGQRTWGGPRADAAKADDHTSPEEAVEQARAQGDELNVRVDSFRAKADKKGVPIRPSEHIDGRLSGLPVARDRYSANHEALAIPLASLMTPLPDIRRFGLHRYHSTESVITDSSGNSICLPTNVESLMNEEDRAKRLMAHEAQEHTTLLQDLADDAAGTQGSVGPLRSDTFGDFETDNNAEQSLRAHPLRAIQSLQNGDNSVDGMHPEVPHVVAEQSIELGVTTGNHPGPQWSRGRRLQKTSRRISQSRRNPEHMV
ncbi:hypothetical protein BBP40_002638 [Aspergillus hancockii]|nr:hypothetical protein BBP40_002638 [Aspergillus hancockii]